MQDELTKEIIEIKEISWKTTHCQMMMILRTVRLRHDSYFERR